MRKIKITLLRMEWKWWYDYAINTVVALSLALAAFTVIVWFHAS